MITGIVAGIIAAVAAVLASNGLWQFIIHKSDKKDELKRAATKEDIEELKASMVTKEEHAELVLQMKRVEAGSLATLHKELYDLALRTMDAGAITTEELEDLDALYKAYHALGGNSTGTNYYERARKLPLKNERSTAWT